MQFTVKTVIEGSSTDVYDDDFHIVKTLLKATVGEMICGTKIRITIEKVEN